MQRILGHARADHSNTVVQHDVGVPVLAEVNVALQDVMMSGDQKLSVSMPLNVVHVLLQDQRHAPKNLRELLVLLCHLEFQWFAAGLHMFRVVYETPGNSAHPWPLPNCVAVARETKRASNDIHRDRSDVSPVQPPPRCRPCGRRMAVPNVATQHDLVQSSFESTRGRNGSFGQDAMSPGRGSYAHLASWLSR